jgi:hypothetical protein
MDANGFLRTVQGDRTMTKTLARFFSAMHQAFGITDLPSDATPTQERNFVLMWLGIILFGLFWIALIFVFMFYLGLRR